MANPLPSATATIVLAAPNGQPQAQAIAASLHQAGWAVIVTPDPHFYVGQAQTCAVLLSPQTLNDPYVGAAIQANFPCLIPVLTEPLTLPNAAWSVAAVFVAPDSTVTATAIAQTATQGAMPWSFASPYHPSVPTQADASATPLAFPHTPSAMPPQPAFFLAAITQRFTGLAPWQRALAVGLPMLIVLVILLVAFVHPKRGTTGKSIAAQINLTGTWKETITAGNLSSDTITLVLHQTGSAISGTLTDNRSDTVDLVGTLNGHAITLHAKGDGTVPIDYQQQGTVANDVKSMLGTITLTANILSQNVTTTGTWKATR